jgi:acetate kinase
VNVLVLNAGSSSLKWERIGLGTGERRGGEVEEVADQVDAVAAVIAELGDAQVDAVGHRVVHGGEAFTAPTVLDDGTVARLRELVPLAPLHLPANLAGIDAAMRRWPDVPHVAVFDTAFHRTLPPAAHRYAVPRAWYLEYGVRRYGFHGTSVAYVAAQAATVLGRPLDELDLIVAHLGNGASMTAVHAGVSVDTSMGMSPLEGLVMGSRSGDVDPTVVAHVASVSGRPIAEVIDDLSTASGLLGLCGSSDAREVLERAAVGDDEAVLAIDVFVHRVRRYLGAFLVVLGRCDAVVFTAGIGEHSSLIRRRVCADLGGLGITLDPGRNDRGEVTISPDGASTAVLVIPTDEEAEIASHVAAAAGARLSTPPPGGHP